MARALLAAALAAALLAAASAAAGPARAASATKFSITGRGWGHGIGMSAYGAYGYAKHGWSYSAILKHYYTGIGFGRTANRDIRIHLCGGIAAVNIHSDSGFKASSYGRTVSLPSGTARVTWDSGKYRVTAGDSHWLFDHQVTFVPGSSRLELLHANDIGYVGHYRGALRVIHGSGGFTVVNKLPLESYLLGVVPREVPSSWPAASLKAMACAARAFAARAIGGGTFDLYSGTRSQAYGGFEAETASTNAAVNQTKGVVPVYGGQPITAMYFSTSGGHTESIQNVWNVPAVPYLKGVSDPYDYYSPYHTWPRRIEGGGELGRQLGSYARGSLRAICVVKRGTSPRIKRALVIGSSGVSQVSGADLRARLGLRDTWVFFTSMSIAPTSATVDSGGGVRISGNRYPALKAGAWMTVHFHPTGGGWATRRVRTTRTASVVAGYRVYSSKYVYVAKPTRTTEYYVTSSGGGVSPRATIRVRAAASASP